MSFTSSTFLILTYKSPLISFAVICSSDTMVAVISPSIFISFVLTCNQRPFPQGIQYHQAIDLPVFDPPLCGNTGSSPSSRTSVDLCGGLPVRIRAEGMAMIVSLTLNLTIQES